MFVKTIECRAEGGLLTGTAEVPQYDTVEEALITMGGPRVLEMINKTLELKIRNKWREAKLKAYYGRGLTVEEAREVAANAVAGL